jgi:hypothetical protein
MPRQTFTAGSVLTAAQLNIVSDQTVMTFAGTAARGSAIPTPTEGMVVWLQDSDSLELYNGAGWVGLSNQTIPTAKTASYTAVAADNGVLLQFNSASPLTFTFSTAIPVGGRVDIVQTGAGALSVAAGAGLTLQSYLNYTKLAGQHAWAAVVRLNAGTAGLVGNLIAN